MNNVKFKYIFTVLILSFVWSINSSFQKSSELTKEQAIENAEQFIIDNGYTDLPHDETKMSYELFDALEKCIDSVVMPRTNTLHKKAFCIAETEDEWYVGFLSKHYDLDKIDSKERQTNLVGRSVTVLKNGKGITIAHKDPLFSLFEKL